MISDREEFWDSRNPSKNPQCAEVDDQGTTHILQGQEIQETFKKIKGKRILLLIHGFEDLQPASTYFHILSDIKNWDIASHYDHVIGYVWPCYDSFWNYYGSERNLNITTQRLRRLLYKMKITASTVDVAAHGLGNQLVLQALNYEKKKEHLGIVDNFFTIAPNVKSDSPLKIEGYARAVQNCSHMHVFFNDQENDLKWLYPLFEKKQSLNDATDSDHDAPLSNIRMINCPSPIECLYSKPIFEHIGELTALNQTPSANTSR